MADTAVAYDLLGPAFLEDPYPTLAEMREHEPLYRDPMGIYHLTRYSDVWALLRDHRCGRDMPIEVATIGIGDGEVTRRFFTENLLGMEGADHTRLRRLMSGPFTPKRIRDLESSTAVLVDELLRDTGGAFDMIEDFASKLPVYVICDLLGLPREDRELVRPWATTLADNTSMFPTPEQQAANEAANQAFWNYFEDLLAGRRQYSDDGVFAALVAAETEDGRLSRDELIVNSALLFFAGFETTTNLIGNGMLALLRNPGQFDRLRRDPSLVATAVDEMLRYDSPVQTAPRFTHEAIEVSGGTIKANRVINLRLSAANRDPRAFQQPDTFDVGRVPNDHVAFGSGAHFCLGSHLARLEGRLAFDAFVTRYSSIDADGPHVWRQSAGLRGLRTLPVRLTPR